MSEITLNNNSKIKNIDDLFNAIMVKYPVFSKIIRTSERTLIDPYKTSDNTIPFSLITTYVNSYKDGAVYSGSIYGAEKVNMILRKCSNDHLNVMNYYSISLFR